MKQYDYIFSGGGAAGLSLAYHFMRSSLRDRRILIIDRDPKRSNDRTWCFWANKPNHFSAIYFRSWEKLAFSSSDFSQVYTLSPFRYNMLRGIDFYEFTRSELSSRPNIDFLTAPISQIWETPDTCLVAAGGETFMGSWVFDSRFGPNDLLRNPARYHYLKQHFVGWEIETSSDTFDPAVPVLFDFRTPQLGSMRFFYVLPYSTRSALVEYTLFSAQTLTSDEYDNGLREYIHRVLRVDDYKIHAIESGVIPMTDHPLRRKAGARILNIGTRGGRVKPSSGYAFLRIQQDSAAIVRSMERFGHPFALPETHARYRLFDSILLQILYRRGDLAEAIFTDLFKNNPIHRIFSFLDESAGWLENYHLVASVPPIPFVWALFRLKLLRKI